MVPESGAKSWIESGRKYSVDRGGRNKTAESESGMNLREGLGRTWQASLDDEASCKSTSIDHVFGEGLRARCGEDDCEVLP